MRSGSPKWCMPSDARKWTEKNGWMAIVSQQQWHQRKPVLLLISIFSSCCIMGLVAVAVAVVALLMLLLWCDCCIVALPVATGAVVADGAGLLVLCWWLFITLVIGYCWLLLPCRHSCGGGGGRPCCQCSCHFCSAPAPAAPAIPTAPTAFAPQRHSCCSTEALH